MTLANLIANLTDIRDLEKANKQTFKVRAYDKVLTLLKNYTGKDIKTFDEFKDAGFKGVGKGILEKVEQIFNTGVIQKVEDNRIMMEAVNALSMVHGIGPTKANELYTQHGISTVEELLSRTDLLNKVQIKGLRYHADCLKRIPRAEMDKHNALLKTIINVPFSIAGSYRRKEASSGDIDVIICGNASPTSPRSPRSSKATAAKAKDITYNPLDDMIDALEKSKYMVDTLAHGDKKFMGICKLPRFRTFRRIDLMVIDPERYPFALLYFTGSKTFNVKMRFKALKMGYSLNEFGFTPPVQGKVFRTERDIFDFLEMKYVDPEHRK